MIYKSLELWELYNRFSLTSHALPNAYLIYWQYEANKVCKHRILDWFQWKKGQPGPQMKTGGDLDPSDTLKE